MALDTIVLARGIPHERNSVPTLGDVIRIHASQFHWCSSDLAIGSTPRLRAEYWLTSAAASLTYT